MLRLNRSGISMIEVAIGAAIAVLGFIGSLKIYSYINLKNRTVEMNRIGATLAESVTRNLARDQKANWLALSGGGCTSGLTTTLNFPAFTGTEFQVSLLDNTKLNALLPASDPLRVAIVALIAEFGPQASGKCSDTTVLSTATYAALAISEANQVLCRCASALTPYGTLQAKLSSFPNRLGLYACVEIAASATASSSSSVTALLNQKPVILESVYSLFNVSNNTENSCQQIAGVTPAKALSRLEYTLFAVRESSVGKNQGTYLMD